MLPLADIHVCFSTKYNSLSNLPVNSTMVIYERTLVKYEVIRKSHAGSCSGDGANMLFFEFAYYIIATNTIWW
jgi:hypothetical protein